jgi:two-component system phosphate regulon sensor histidine kinase PhoR
LRSAYRYEAARLAALMLLGLLGGLQAGHPALGLLLGLLWFLLEHVYQLARLVYLTTGSRRIRLPYPAGLWGEIYRFIAYHQERSRKRKRGLVRFATRFREAANAVPDALVILREQNVEWANAACASLLGFSWPAANGRPVSELIQSPDLGEYIEGGDYHQPVDFVPAHNRAIVLSLRVTPFGGKKHQRLLVARDITKIYHLNQIRRDFVANVSHELRTPLTVINGFVENLLDAAATPDALHRPLSLMQAQGRRMQSIIEDLLTLSRLEMAEKASDQIPVEVPELLAQITTEATTLSPDHPLQLNIDPRLWLLGNPAELRSAFSNLVFNAVRHTQEGTRVTVTWQLRETGPAFTVQDNGEGIHPNHLPRLTERFYRVDKGRSRASGGTGLGLAIVKHVLSRYEAELLVASKPGQGSTFTCRFPPHLTLQQPPTAPATETTTST